MIISFWLSPSISNKTTIIITQTLVIFINIKGRKWKDGNDE